MISGLLFFYIWIKQQDIISAYRTDKLKELAVLPSNLWQENAFDEYKIDSTIIYLIKNPYAATYDKLPSTNPQGLPFHPYTGNKMQSIETIELRGKTLQDGFRTKRVYKYTEREYRKIYRAIPYRASKEVSGRVFR